MHFHEYFAFLFFLWTTHSHTAFQDVSFLFSTSRWMVFLVHPVQFIPSTRQSLTGPCTYSIGFDISGIGSLPTMGLCFVFTSHAGAWMHPVCRITGRRWMFLALSHTSTATVHLSQISGELDVSVHVNWPFYLNFCCCSFRFNNGQFVLHCLVELHREINCRFFFFFFNECEYIHPDRSDQKDAFCAFLCFHLPYLIDWLIDRLSINRWLNLSIRLVWLGSRLNVYLLSFFLITLGLIDVISVFAS